ncbi:hypothetical protein [Agromyces protaetiae]|uniref:hypothetical protein n=1 Tax=Agromyces protaetiae TaxID=2509455 RepID=UPI0013E9F0E1|nr:hypothetical protein [Agromyces protaetiae]
MAVTRRTLLLGAGGAFAAGTLAACAPGATERLADESGIFDFTADDAFVAAFTADPTMP